MLNTNKNNQLNNLSISSCFFFVKEKQSLWIDFYRKLFILLDEREWKMHRSVNGVMLYVLFI
jgi:hypothetical protein